MSPEVSFYLAPSRLDLPLNEITQAMDDPSACGERFFHQTWFNWTLQTYLRLRAVGFPCTLHDQIPSSGIVIAARCDLPFGYKPHDKQLVVCTVADGTPHPYAQVQIIQNPAQCAMGSNFFHIPHWPQPGLVPRNTQRGSRCETVGYFGHRDQLAAELKSPGWPEFLARLGLEWRPSFEDSKNKTSYEEIDLIVGIRSFDGGSYDHKPASKLFNAWHAGVPAILGPESAYRAERLHENDFLEASTLAELQNAIRLLADDPGRRIAMMRNGVKRAEGTKIEIITRRWQTLIKDELEPLHAEWCALSPIKKKLFRSRRWLSVRRSGAKHRIARIQKSAAAVVGAKRKP